jgi:dolichol kinase
MLLMVAAITAALCIAAILIFSEFAWDRLKFRDEAARKLVHITAGTFIAFLPFWVDYIWIIVLAVGFIAVNTINHMTKTFHAILSVRRRSLGDIFLGVGVLILALFEPPAWLFAASILQVSLADGVAALAGVTYGKKHGMYYLFGQPKSYIGSAAFVLVSAIILVALFIFNSYFADPISMWPVVIMLPLMLVCIENLAVFGSDNIFLPVITVGVLSLL